MLKKWEDLPGFMRVDEVKPYWEALCRKKVQLFLKKVFDLIAAFILFVLLLIPMLVIAIVIKLDSQGSVFYRQERVTAYGKRFRIHKFRTMVTNAERIGTAVTVGNDSRITKAGSRLRKVRLDELPQIIDVLQGNMSFVGTRPEAIKYVEKYEPEWYATLLQPAGITSECSIHFKDEDKLLDNAYDVDKVYMERVLPEKMRWNLESIKSFSFARDLKTMLRTLATVLGKDYE